MYICCFMHRMQISALSLLIQIIAKLSLNPLNLFTAVSINNLGICARKIVSCCQQSITNLVPHQMIFYKLIPWYHTMVLLCLHSRLTNMEYCSPAYARKDRSHCEDFQCRTSRVIKGLRLLATHWQLQDRTISCSSMTPNSGNSVAL